MKVGRKLVVDSFLRPIHGNSSHEHKYNENKVQRREIESTGDTVACARYNEGDG